LFDNIASIDAGYSSVKLIKAKRGIRNFEITSVKMEEYDLDQFETDSAATISNAILRLISNEDLSEYRVITTLPSDSVIFRNISFPFNDISKINEILPYEAEESIPYPIENVVLDFQLLPNIDPGANIILSALNKNILDDKINIFTETGLKPHFAGIEANAHLRCYEYFNSVNNENILVIDLGHKKTVVNIIADGTLLFTRSITKGVSDLIYFIADLLKISLNNSRDILKGLDLDLGSFDANIKSDNFKNLNISKQKLKKIYDYASELIDDMVEELSLTIKAGSSFNEFIEFSRIIITGGGSNIRGIPKIFGEDTGIPVVFMPFLSGYLDPDIRSRYSVSLGNLLVFMNHKNSSVNFIKGDYSHHITGETSKKYLLPAVFVFLTVAVFILNIIITFLQVSRSKSYTDEILTKNYKRYFSSKTIPKDPIKEATLLIQKEQKELNVLRDLIGDEEPFIPLLNLITDSFNGAEGFDIKKLNFDGKGISIEGETSNSADLEDFKKNLLDSGEFETVSLDIRDTSKSRSLFTMTIKKKL